MSEKPSQDEKYVSESIIDSFWSQYENMIKGSQNQEMFLSALEEWLKWRKESQHFMEDYYGEAKKVNQQAIESISNFLKNSGKGYSTIEIEANWNEFVKGLEKITETPYKAATDTINQFEHRVKNDSEACLNYWSEYQKSWNQYIKPVKNYQQSMARHIEENFRTMVGMRG